MAYHYLRVAWRALIRKKTYTVTTLTGLSLGLASCMLILLFVIDELSFDAYHANKERIYRLATEIEGTDFNGIAKVAGPWGPAALKEIPEVEAMTRFVMTGQLLVQAGQQKHYEPNGFYADPSVFEMFSYRVIHGNSRSCLSDPGSIAISASFAGRYFGSLNAIGKTLTIDGDTEYQVTAVFEDVPSTSHFTFDYLLSMENLHHPQKDNWTQWNQFYTYLLLHNGSEPARVARQVKQILDRNIDPQSARNYKPFLQPLGDIHLRSHLHREIRPNSDVLYIYIFSSIALLILAISCANFVNMSTAQATARAKEIGVRKINGAVRGQLIIQFMTESFLICMCSMVIAIMLTILALPVLNELTIRNIQPSLLWTPAIITAMIAITLATAILAGGYPALYQASLMPMQVLKGPWAPSGGIGLRKALVVFQFTLSSTLIIAAIVIFQQLRFIQDKPTGFNPAQIINIPIQADALRTNYQTVRNELMKHPQIRSVSLSGNIPGGSDWGIPSLPEGFTYENTPATRVMAVDHQFLETYGITLAAGRNFSDRFASDTAAYLINEEAARQLGWHDPLSKTYSMPVVGRGQGPVIGVVKDFHFRSVREKISPLLFLLPDPNWFSIYSIKIDSHNIPETLAYIEQQWSVFDPEHPFTYSFFDEAYGQLYQQERRLATIVAYFTGIGIFLACLGLYSLASYTAERRKKEIGIRKVIGASTGQIVAMLTRQYLGLSLAGFVIALPLTWYILQQWLESFAYHATISASIIAACALLVVLVAFISVGYRAIRSARANPAGCLRNE